MRTRFITVLWRKIKKSDHRGMFLLESILATVILAVSISIIIESLVSGLRASRLTGHYSEVLLLSDHILAGVLAERSRNASAGDEEFPEPNQEYSYRLETEDVAGQGQAGLRQARLTVFWKSGRKDRDISIDTWVFNPPQNEKPSSP